MGENRIYRRLYKGKDLHYFTIQVRETDLEIGATCDLHKEATELVRKYRRQIEHYIWKNPVFLTSLDPVDSAPDAPAIVATMCEAGKKAGVGPMAAVAGAISEFVGRDLLSLSPEIVVENGGDLFVAGEQDRVIGIYAGNSPFSDRLGLRVPANTMPLGICTSSGTIGHSLSLGTADAVTVISKDVALADAVATATGNIVKTPNDIRAAINFAKGIDGVLGVLVIIGDKMSAWGAVELIML